MRVNVLGKMAGNLCANEKRFALLVRASLKGYRINVLSVFELRDK